MSRKDGGIQMAGLRRRVRSLALVSGIAAVGLASGAFAAAIDFAPRRRLGFLGPRLPKTVRSERRPAHLSPTRRPVRPGCHHRAGPDPLADRRVPNCERGARQGWRFGIARLSGHDQLPVRDRSFQDPQRLRDRLWPDGSRLARHDLSKVPVVNSRRGARPRLPSRSPSLRRKLDRSSGSTLRARFGVRPDAC